MPADEVAEGLSAADVGEEGEGEGDAAEPAVDAVEAGGSEAHSVVEPTPAAVARDPAADAEPDGVGIENLDGS